MASFIFNSYLNDCLDRDSGIDVGTDDIRVALINNATDNAALSASSTANMGGVTQYSSTSPGHTLTNQDAGGTTYNVFDSTDTITFSSVAIDGAKDAEAIVLYKYVDGGGTNDLVVAKLDFASAVTPNGGDINVTVNASGFFSL